MKVVFAHIFFVLSSNFQILYRIFQFFNFAVLQFFLPLHSDDTRFPHSSTHQWLGQDDNCPRVDGVIGQQRTEGAALQMWT